MFYIRSGCTNLGAEADCRVVVRYEPNDVVRLLFSLSLGVNIKIFTSVCLSIALLCVARPSLGSENLEPCEEPPIENYYKRVDELLDGAVSGEVVARFTTIPSFTPESGIRITQNGDVLEIHHVQLLESVWASSWLPPSRSGRVDFELTREDLPRNSKSIQAPRKLTEAVLKLVNDEVRRSVRSDAMGYDGTSYFFRPTTTLCAKTWSPADGSRPSKLVALVNGLGSLAHASNTESTKRVESAMYSLIAELSSQ